jgi:hypothetical protein
VIEDAESMSTSNERPSSLSRRTFATRTALATAAVVIPAHLGSGGPATPEAAEAVRPITSQDESFLSALSPAGRVRFDTMWEAVIRKHGARLTDAQKTLMRRIIASDAKMLDAVYAVPLENGDASATTLRLATGAPLPQGD